MEATRLFASSSTKKPHSSALVLKAFPWLKGMAKPVQMGCKEQMLRLSMATLDLSVKQVYWGSQTQACSYLYHKFRFLTLPLLLPIQRFLLHRHFRHKKQTPSSATSLQLCTAFNYMGCTSTASNAGHGRTS